MTISTTASRIAYTGNGVTTAFSFPYRFFANTDLVVVKVSTLGVETTLVLTTDYTVTGADLDAGGTVTCVVAPAAGERLVIYRDMDYTQEVDYTSGDSFPAETHERALDRLTMQNQQLKDAVDRSVKVSETSTVTPDELVESINDAVVAAAASATAADASADAAALSATAADASADAAAASAASIDPASLLTKAGNLSGLASAATARSNLGLVIGTDVLAPNGNGTSLTGIKKIAQRVFTFSGALGTGTATIPWDDTIPQNTEGTQFQSQSFTPTNTSSTLVIEAVLQLATSVDNRVIAALFQSGSANAIAAAGHYMQTANGHCHIYLRAEMTAGTTSAITFTSRAGLGSAGTITFNGANAARIFGGVSASWIAITEYLA